MLMRILIFVMCFVCAPKNTTRASYAWTMIFSWSSLLSLLSLLFTRLVCVLWWCSQVWWDVFSAEKHRYQSNADCRAVDVHNGVLHSVLGAYFQSKIQTVQVSLLLDMLGTHPHPDHINDTFHIPHSRYVYTCTTASQTDVKPDITKAAYKRLHTIGSSHRRCSMHY